MSHSRFNSIPIFLARSIRARYVGSTDLTDWNGMKKYVNGQELINLYNLIISYFDWFFRIFLHFNCLWCFYFWSFGRCGTNSGIASILFLPQWFFCFAVVVVSFVCISFDAAFRVIDRFKPGVTLDGEPWFEKSLLRLFVCIWVEIVFGAVARPSFFGFKPSALELLEFIRVGITFGVVICLTCISFDTAFRVIDRVETGVIIGEPWFTFERSLTKLLVFFRVDIVFGVFAGPYRYSALILRRSTLGRFKFNWTANKHTNMLFRKGIIGELWYVTIKSFLKN